MNTFSKHCLWVAMAAACQSVMADDVDIEEVIVTASPFAKSAEAVSRPVNLLAGENLQNAASATLGETLSGQLGVSSASFGPGVGLPIIRGQSDNRVKVMQDSVGTMDASAASPDHAISLEPLLATKIEVLRGPAALRYGSGAIGGVVNVIDNRIPSSLPKAITGGAELRNSSSNDEDAAVVNLNMGAGNMAFHVDGVKRKSGNMSIPDESAQFKTDELDEPIPSTNGYIANTDAESQSATLGSSYIGDDGFIGISINTLDNNYGVPPDSDDRVRIDMHQTRYDLKAEANKPLAGFEKLSLRLGHNDYEHTEMENGEAGTKFTNDAYEGRAELIHTPVEFFTLNWQGAVGVQLSESTFAAIGEEAFIPKSDIKNLGFFILEEAKQGDFVYELGVRSDNQTIAPDVGDSVQHQSLNLSGTTTWHFTESQKITTGIAQSQRAPSVEELFANGPHPATGSFLIGDENLSEETSRNIELGYHWHQPRVEFSGNLFYNRIANFIYSNNINSLIDDLNGYKFTQADATFKGMELELKVALSNAWNLRLFGDSVTATLDSGEYLPRITPPRVGSSLDYNLNAWSSNLSFTQVSKQDHAGAYESQTDAYNRLDARVSYTLKCNEQAYTLFLKATNLSDETIRNASSYLREIAPEAGRGVQVGIRATF